MDITENTRKELTHTLTGLDAAVAMLLEEVQTAFHKDEKLRVDYYVMTVMCSAPFAYYECRKSRIIETLEVMHAYSGFSAAEYRSALIRLVRRGFLYSKGGRSERCYALNLARYDTDEVAA